ncbi:MAG: lytic transglycosylase domain-containing protein [Magnetococcales bacterium]|nr:lytic transglycosylase domain-containing protein [Magnetococcales bacterium]
MRSSKQFYGVKRYAFWSILTVVVSLSASVTAIADIPVKDEIVLSSVSSIKAGFFYLLETEEQQVLSTGNTKRPPVLKPRRVHFNRVLEGGLAKVPPVLKPVPKNYSTTIKRLANRYKVEPALVHAVIQAESSFNPNALSPKGAVGLMQLMPETAAKYGVRDRWDPENNIHAGARHLRRLLHMFKNNLTLSLAAYNAGENAVRRYGNRVPPYRETRRYVQKVLRYYREYRNAM